ncbi:MAG TPA: hypothetical protein VLB74_13085, partial [Flavobacterium sp.]|uniref:tetratricopeptide repeat protein n=1 Tax=Flavobacterium sp. TaxID=239 RepID=UPI002BE64513
MNAPSKPNLYYIFVTITYLLFVLSSSSLFAQSPAAVKKIEKQFDLANDYAHSGNPGKAIPILYKIKEDCEKINYKQGITRVGHTLAIIYFNSTDYKKVITLDDEFLRIGEEIKDYEKLCQIHRLKGCAYSELGLLNKDNEERLESLKYAKKIQNRNSRQQAISLIYGNLANHYIKSGAPKDSVFVNISKSITEAKKIDDADASFRSKKYSLIAYSYLTLGDQFSKAGQPETAENYFLKALEIHNSQPVPFIEQVTLLSELGYFYYVQKKYEKAVKYAELGVNYEKKASFPQIRRDLFETLSKSYLELHKTDDSKRYLGLFTALNDSISNVDKSAVNLALSHSISNQKKMFVDYTGKRTALYVLSSLTFIVFGGWFFLAY